MEVPEDRRNLDQIEIEYFAHCSTQIYVQYRSFLDKNIKMIMVDLAEWQEQNTSLDNRSVNKMFLERYQLFWRQFSSKIEAFYEEVQSMFKESVEALKKCQQNESDMCPQDIITLDDSYAEQIDDLQAEYITEKYYLNELKKRLESLKRCKQQKDKLQLALKISKKEEEEHRKITKIETKIDEVILKVGTKPIMKKVCASIITSNCNQGLHKNDIMKKLTASRESKKIVTGCAG